jgi:hypothetical protein
MAVAGSGEILGSARVVELLDGSGHPSRTLGAI